VTFEVKSTVPFSEQWQVLRPTLSALNVTFGVKSTVPFSEQWQVLRPTLSLARPTRLPACAHVSQPPPPLREGKPRAQGGGLRLGPNQQPQLNSGVCLEWS
jgi:hypothetical protein